MLGRVRPQFVQAGEGQDAAAVVVQEVRHLGGVLALLPLVVAVGGAIWSPGRRKPHALTLALWRHVTDGPDEGRCGDTFDGRRRPHMRDEGGPSAVASLSGAPALSRRKGAQMTRGFVPQRDEAGNEDYSVMRPDLDYLVVSSKSP